MHLLQHLKKGAVEAVLDLLAVTGRVEASLHVLSHGPDVADDQRYRQYPLSLEQVSFSDDLSGIRFCQDIMAQPQAWASCLAFPQWLIVYKVKGKSYQYRCSLIRDEKGNWHRDVINVMKVAQGDVNIKQVMQLIYEYPVGVLPALNHLYAPGFKRPQYNHVLGCTMQTLHLKPGLGNVGLDFDTSEEHGTEYGDVLQTSILGRGLRPHGILIENTQFFGTRPWELRLENALAILQGNLADEPLPDVSRFPPKPSR